MGTRARHRTNPPPPYLQLDTGFQVYRTLRSTSQLEGYHLHLRLIIDPRGRHGSLRYKMAKINWFDFRWSLRALIKAGLHPSIDHCHRWLRDELYDMVKGTDLEGKLKELDGWTRLDTSKMPIVPRGLVHAARAPVGDLAQPAAQASRKRTLGLPHSQVRASEWLEAVTQRSAPARLLTKEQKALALPHLVAHPELTPLQLWELAGLDASAAAIQQMREDVEKQVKVNAALKEVSFQQLTANSRATVGSAVLRTTQTLSVDGPSDGTGPLPVGSRKGGITVCSAAEGAVAVAPAPADGSAGAGGEGGGEGEQGKKEERKGGSPQQKADQRKWQAKSRGKRTKAQKDAANAQAKARMKRLREERAAAKALMGAAAGGGDISVRGGGQGGGAHGRQGGRGGGSAKRGRR